MKVRTLREHGNAYGKKYLKTKGYSYEHPSPQQLLDDGLVELTAAGKKEVEAEQPPA